jgi:hypothetical protein
MDLEQENRRVAEVDRDTGDLEQDIADLHDKIDDLTDMVESQSKIVKKLYNRSQYMLIFNSIKWIVIIGVAIGAFYFIQPAIDAVMSLYGTVTGSNGNGDGSTGLGFLNFLMPR